MVEFREAFLIGCVAAMLGATSAGAANIIDTWDSVKAPAAPKIEEVAIDAKTTALLVLDFNAPICVPDKTPRCAPAVDAAAKLLAAARLKGAMVVYTTGGGGKASDIAEKLKPIGAEPVILGSSDKFFGTDLEKVLKDKGIKTVLATGVASNGAVLFTATAAVRRGFAVLVAVDAMSSGSDFADQFSAWQLANSPGQAGKIKLTTVDKVTYQ
jgi:nicotinamidase-related amidase